MNSTQSLISLLANPSVAMSVPRETFDKLVAYDPSNFPFWVRWFRTLLTLGNFTDVLDGKITVTTITEGLAAKRSLSRSRQRASVGGSSDNQTDDSATEIEILTPEGIFKQKLQTIFRTLVNCVMLCPLEKEKQTAMNIIFSVDEGDGKAAYEALVKHHDNPSTQNKLEALYAFVDNKMKTGEDVSAYQLRADSNFKRIDRLKVTLKDMQTALFIGGLSKEFEPLKTSLFTFQGELNFEKASADAKGFEQRLRSTSDTNFAYFADASSPPSTMSTPSCLSSVSSQSADDDFIVRMHVSPTECAYISRLREQGPGGGQKKKRRLEHNIEDHPDTPTEFEKTLTCDNCNIHGHAKRTCDKEPSSANKSKKSVHKSNLATVSLPSTSSSRVIFEETGSYEGWF